MEAYNKVIYEQGQSGLSCEYNYQQPSFLLSDYGLNNEIFGVISIPAMDLEMPIYLGATNQHMADGAAHMSQTSLPIGGSNTNCVIAGTGVTAGPVTSGILKSCRSAIMFPSQISGKRFATESLKSKSSTPTMWKKY